MKKKPQKTHNGSDTSSNELYNCNDMVLPRTENILFTLMSALLSNSVQI